MSGCDLVFENFYNLVEELLPLRGLAQYSDNCGNVNRSAKSNIDDSIDHGFSGSERFDQFRRV